MEQNTEFVGTTLLIPGKRPGSTGDPAADRTAKYQWDRTYRNATEGGYKNKTTDELRARISQLLTDEDERAIISVSVDVLPQYRKTGERMFKINQMGLATDLSSASGVGNVLGIPRLRRSDLQAAWGKSIITCATAAAAKRSQDMYQFLYAPTTPGSDQDQFLKLAQELQGDDFIFDFAGVKQVEEEGRYKYGAFNSQNPNSDEFVVLAMKAKDEMLKQSKESAELARRLMKRQIDLERGHPARKFEAIPGGVEGYAFAVSSVQAIDAALKSAPGLIAGSLKAAFQSISSLFQADDD